MVLKENLMEHEKQTSRTVIRDLTKVSLVGGKKPKWGKNMNKAYQEKSLYLKSVCQGKSSMMGEAEVENKLT